MDENPAVERPVALRCGQWARAPPFLSQRHVIRLTGYEAFLACVGIRARRSLSRKGIARLHVQLHGNKRKRSELQLYDVLAGVHRSRNARLHTLRDYGWFNGDNHHTGSGRGLARRDHPFPCRRRLLWLRHPNRRLINVHGMRLGCACQWPPPGVRSHYRYPRWSPLDDWRISQPDLRRHRIYWVRPQWRRVLQLLR